MAEEVSNKQVVLKDYVVGFPKESDMEVKTSNINLKLPEDSNGILLKNLYLSCDPYMRSRMTNRDRASYVESFLPGSACAQSRGLCAARVVLCLVAIVVLWLS
uniref:Oxidoreductase N-terminal domain-containing protein n=1 Tax=Chenopodium quinoa TaxID=63459 RepID=A0A803M5L5_CHEQI